MKQIRLIHATAFFLALGIVGSVEARQDKPEKQDEKAKPEKRDERAKPSNQEQQAKPQGQQQEKPASAQEKQQANRQGSQQSQKRGDSENQSGQDNAAKPQVQAKRQQEQQQQQSDTKQQKQQQMDNSNKHEQQIAKGQQDQQRHQQQEQQNNSRNQQQQGGEQQSRDSASSQRHSSAEAHQQQMAFQEDRAHSWQSEHRNWQQRGGYNGYRVPDDRFHEYYGQGHTFRIYSLPVVFIGGQQRFQYGGYWFGLIDPWPEYWSSDWYDSDDVYVNYDGDGYYLYNRRYPSDRVAISFYLN